MSHKKNEEKKTSDEKEINNEELTVCKQEDEKISEPQNSEPEKEEVKELTLEEKYTELEKQNSEIKDQYLRKIADFDNYRKRMIKEKQDAFDYANTAILTDMVAILDDFDRALTASGEAKDTKSVVEGIKMINKQMHGFLDSKYNLTSYAEKGDLFDPNIHEAIASEQADVAEPTCSEVYLKGYMLKDRVIRPAKVMVQMPNNKE